MVCIARDTRSAQGDHFGWHPSTGPDVDERIGHVFVNNLLTGDASFDRPLLLVWQPAVLCEKLSETPLKQFDNNVFVNQNDSYKTLAFWSPSKAENCQIEIKTFDELKNLSGASTKSLVLEGKHLPLFKSAVLDNYQLLDEFPGKTVATEISATVKKLMGIPSDTKGFVGAYVSK
jgi:hypothetical protein